MSRTDTPTLGVNVDHIGTLRNARGGFEPDPVRAALVCQKAGAHSIVMHLREDRRHIIDRDLFRAKKALSIRLNMEMSIAPDIVRVARKLKPTQATLVPEKRHERTTEGGLDLYSKRKLIFKTIQELQEKGIEVSLFIDPSKKQIDTALEMGAEAIEFHTGDYSLQTTVAGRKREFDRLGEGLRYAQKTPLLVHAGHGLDYRNVAPLVKLGGFSELNIGYSIITRAAWVGLDRAVREMIVHLKARS